MPQGVRIYVRAITSAHHKECHLGPGRRLESPVGFQPLPGQSEASGNVEKRYRDSPLFPTGS
jgi:hypothetical protein